MTIRAVVLAVDDDPGVLDAYQAILEPRCEVVTASDGRSALDVLQQRTVDVTLLDMLMPGLNGLAVLDAIRRLEIETSVVVVSAVNDSRSALSALRLGARDYLNKPFDVTELELVVRRLAADATCPGAVPGPQRRALPHALVVSGDLGLRAGLAVALRTRGRVDAVAGATGARAVLTRTLPDVVVVDAPAGDERTATAVRHHAAAAELVVVDSRGLSDLEARLHDVVGVLAVRHNEVRRFGGPVPRVIAHVCEHFRRTTVEAVADAVGVSPGHLARVFTEQMEMTVKEYVTQVKIEAAKALFRETDAKAEAIAELVGLYDAPHLARVFRRHHCSTPASYRPR